MRKANMNSIFRNTASKKLSKLHIGLMELIVENARGEIQYTNTEKYGSQDHINGNDNITEIQPAKTFVKTT